MNEPNVVPAFLRTKQAAAFLGISPALLMKQVRLGSGPPRRRIGRVVLYAIADLQAWMDAQRECPA